MNQPPPPFPANLSQFKDWLRQPGVRLKGVRHDINPPPNFYTPRAIALVRNTEFIFADGFTAGFRSARAWSFDPIARTATLTLNSPTTHGDPRLIVYELIEPAA